MDLISITNVLGFLTSKVAALTALAKSLKNPELQLEIVELTGQLVEIKNAYITLQEENAELKRQLEEDKDNPLTVSYPSGILFDLKQLPHCTGCYEGPTRRRVHLSLYASNGKITYTCPVCRSIYVADHVR